MKYEEKIQWSSKHSIDEIVSKRDTYEVNSEEWNTWNKVKAVRLEQIKPSTKEEIIYFRSADLNNVPDGLTITDKLPSIPFYKDRRSLLEYNPTQRHPIPYCIVRFENDYFFILRGSGVGEIRLENKKGLLGGHVDSYEAVESSLEKTLLNGLKRELEEEAGITDNLIKSIKLKGLLKSNTGVDLDHLGVIFEIEVLSKEIDSKEEELTGIWINENELEQHAESFESWAKIIYKEWLKPKTL